MTEVKLYNPTELNREEWADLQVLFRDSVGSTIEKYGINDRYDIEIDALAEMDDPERFYRSHLDPNTEVGRRYRKGQSYSNPRVAVATEANEPVGFMYVANNVSGSNKELKRLSIIKNYLWLREVAVKPDQQRQGIAKQLGVTILKSANKLQPVSAYVWPNEISFLPSVLEQLGFVKTGEDEIPVFGDEFPSTTQIRMQASSVKNVLSLLEKN